MNLEATTFEKLVLFNNVTINTPLDLSKTTFKDEANFLGIKTEVANRETARIIKHSFDKIGNIIEANKFYAKEMKEQEKELTWKNNLSEKLIFNFHKISSNHSQDWEISLYWIFTITLGILIIQYEIVEDMGIYYDISVSYIVTLLIFIAGLSLVEISKQFKIIFVFMYNFILSLAYIAISNDSSLCYVSNMVNPFSIMTGQESLSFYALIYKIIIAYLIYQLIVSIRQNTRRK
jgi:hypothetical protein